MQTILVRRRREMEDLPNELLIGIFDHLQERLSILKKVCKTWQLLITSFYIDQPSENWVACESESLHALYFKYENYLTFKDVSRAILNLPKTKFLIELCIANLSVRLVENLVLLGKIEYLDELMQFIPSPPEFRFSSYYYHWNNLPFFVVLNEKNHITIPWYEAHLRRSDPELTLENIFQKMFDDHGPFRWKPSWQFTWNCTIENCIFISQHFSPSLFLALFLAGHEHMILHSTKQSFTHGMNAISKLEDKLIVANSNDLNIKANLKCFGRKLFLSCINERSSASEILDKFQKLNDFFENVDWCSSLFFRFLKHCCSSSRYDLISLLPSLAMHPPKDKPRFTWKIKKHPSLTQSLLDLLCHYDEHAKVNIVNNLILTFASKNEIPMIHQTICGVGGCGVGNVDLVSSNQYFGYVFQHSRQTVFDSFKNYQSARLFSNILLYLDEFFESNIKVKNKCLVGIYQVIKNNWGFNITYLPFKILSDSKFASFLLLLRNFVDPMTGKQLFARYTISETHGSVPSNFENALVVVENSDHLWYHATEMLDINVLLKNNVPFPKHRHILKRSFFFCSIKTKALRWLLQNGFRFSNSDLFEYCLIQDCFHLLQFVDVSKVGLSNFYPKHRLL